MTEGRAIRLLSAALHSGIAERLPHRLEFYEHWLTTEGLREPSSSLAPVLAVLGFLRTEGPAYDAVMQRAGECAAEWSIMNLSPGRRRTMSWLPRFLRTRAALRIAASIVHTVEGARRTSLRLRRRTARIEMSESIFCNVRATSPVPLCGFHVAVVVETLRQFGIAATGRSDRCRAMTGSRCVLLLEIGGAAAAIEPAEAA